ncbi:unnamed protein product [Rotaria socialis]|uniref:Uncharacterized protein n=1 Tax=Rotaria socialis TaxID=392032 RepID=A0A820NM50_9BILA|nr:unnamed protein product [Rotaria socialis]
MNIITEGGSKLLMYFVGTIDVKKCQHHYDIYANCLSYVYNLRENDQNLNQALLSFALVGETSLDGVKATQTEIFSKITQADDIFNVRKSYTHSQLNESHANTNFNLLNANSNCIDCIWINKLRSLVRSITCWTSWW